MILLDGKEFLVAKRLEHEGNVYLYVIGDDDGKKEFSVLRETIYNDEVFVESVNDEEKVKEIFTIIAEEGL